MPESGLHQRIRNAKSKAANHSCGAYNSWSFSRLLTSTAAWVRE